MIHFTSFSTLPLPNQILIVFGIVLFAVFLVNAVKVVADNLSSQH